VYFLLRVLHVSTAAVNKQGKAATVHAAATADSKASTKDISGKAVPTPKNKGKKKQSYEVANILYCNYS